MIEVLDFVGKMAVIMGVVSGIGCVFVFVFVECGCNFVFVDINEIVFEEFVCMLVSNECKIMIYRVDVGCCGDIVDFVEVVCVEYGVVYLLFNNVGVVAGGIFEEFFEENFEWLVGINFWGLIWMICVFLFLMWESGGGYIINIFSIFGVIVLVG